MREAFVKRMIKDGFTASLLWYNAMLENVHLEAEKKVLNETNVVQVPTLFIATTKDPLGQAATKDPLGQTAPIQQPIQLGLLPDLTVDEIDAGYWCMLSNPQEVGEALMKERKRLCMDLTARCVE